MTDTEVVLRGYRTRLVDQGEGAAVVLVHGTPLDLACWEPLVGELNGRRTIRYDARGHGCAKGVPVPGPAELADDLIAVLDRLQLAYAHLVGHSWGGQIVLRAALDHPDRVNRLSVVCSRAAPFPTFHAVAAGLRAGTVDRTASLTRWFDPDEFARPDPLVTAVRARLEDADTEAWAAALDMIADFDVLDELHRIEVPVDVVAAEHDGVADPAHMARIAGGVRHGELHVVRGAHHLLPLQRPEVVATALKLS
ncbi:MAG: 3-oxoadipate enol-lactonase [Pseudonocardiales bacterium]|nr:3-oxoadipate enol-lactonase [Pseudonocardiales bacterium]